MADMLEIGVTSQEVLEVQDWLRFLRCYDGQINGEYDSATAEAVMLFQNTAGVDETGTLDEDGVARLRDWAHHYHYGSGATHADYGDGGHHQHAAHHSEHHTQHGHHHSEQHSVPTEQVFEASTHGQMYGYDGEPAVHGEPTFWTAYHQTLVNVRHQTVSLAGDNDVAFMQAVDDFALYAHSRVKEYQAVEITGEDIAKQIARSLADLVGIRFCSIIGDEVSKTTKWIIEQVSTGLSHKAGDVAKQAMIDVSTNKSLADAVDAMAHQLKRRHNYLKAEFDKRIGERFEPLYELIKQQQRLSPEDDAWVMRCYGAGDEEMDAVIEEVFGIPRRSRMPEMQAAAYEKLVEDFALVFNSKTGAETSPNWFGDRRTEGEKWRDDPVRRAHVEAREARESYEREGHEDPHYSP